MKMLSYLTGTDPALSGGLARIRPTAILEGSAILTLLYRKRTGSPTGDTKDPDLVQGHGAIWRGHWTGTQRPHPGKSRRRHFKENGWNLIRRHQSQVFNFHSFKQVIPKAPSLHV